MAEKPRQKPPEAGDCGPGGTTTLVIVVSCIVVLTIITYIWIRRTEQSKTVQGNAKDPRVTSKNCSNGKKQNKKKSVKMEVKCDIAMIGDGNIAQYGCTTDMSPTLEEGRNKDPTKIMQRTVYMWEKQAGDVFVTKGLQNVRLASKNNNLLIITGPQGSGKSTALRYASVALKQDGFIVYPCIKPSDIVYYWDDTRKQVFAIDDPIGRDCVSLVNVQMLERYGDSIKHCIAGHTTKVILAVRSEIINDKYVSSSETLVTSRQNELDLTDDENALSEQERKDMLSHYLSKSGVDDNISLQMPNLQCFPLLCHAFCKVGTIRRHSTEFFSSPFSVIKDTFVRMRVKNPPHFCALALCAVYQNKLSSRDLMLESPGRGKVDKVMELLGLNREEVQRKVIYALDALNGVYLTKNGKSYGFLHSLFEDIVTFILGEESTVFLFKYCSSTFLRSHVRITDTPAKTGEHAIVLERSDYKDLAERMCQELRHNIEDIFYHPSLGNRRFLKIFMEQCSRNKIVEFANEKKIPLLAWSCRVEMFRLTHALLENGAHLNVCDESKRSALMWVCRNNCRPIQRTRSMVNDLLEAGADVRVTDKRNQTAIMYAIRKGDVHIVCDLLKHGACVKEVSADLSPLSLAVKCARRHTRAHSEYTTSQHNDEHFSTTIVRLLLEQGADPNFKGSDDKTMLYQSVLRSNTAVSKCLLQNRADVGQSNKLNEDLLCCAIINCPFDFVELLLKNNASVNIVNTFSKSPLHLAVSKNNSDLVRQLIKNGACVNSRDTEGETPLHLCVKGEKYTIRDILLRKGADVNAEDKRGQTPLLWNLKTYSVSSTPTEL